MRTATCLLIALPLFAAACSGVSTVERVHEPGVAPPLHVLPAVSAVRSAPAVERASVAPSVRAGVL